ncbi:ribosome maturation factor RimM [Erysipelothrix tonsillarum]|uniref:ribosome maturation factor RimM n=1 Tax=Erysipelothrix tonsillarum TaxID=38402 RepID=UPI000373FB7D|nr:ribosome maturation factor RimM [Erysipelothrix tonsillarum]
MEHIIIGIIQKPFGIKGEVKVAPKTDFVQERFAPGQLVHLKLGGKTVDYVIASFRRHHGSILIKFEGLDNLNDVEFFHKGEISIDREAQHELPEDEYYFVDLEGCTVYSDGEELGLVTEIMETPAHPVLRIKADERDILVPFVERFIQAVDTKAKRIDINWMEGL